MADIKSRARRAVRVAILRGDLVRPEACEECGKVPPRGSDGRSVIHGHHYKGYDHPLEVQWLCAKCHFAHDPRPACGSNGRAVLTADQVSAARADPRPAHEVAADLGVNRTTIQSLRRGHTWGKLSRAEPYRRPKMPHGDGHCHAKMTAVQVREIRLKAERGASYSALGREYQISKGQARRIARGEAWAHIEVPQ